MVPADIFLQEYPAGLLESIVKKRKKRHKKKFEVRSFICRRRVIKKESTAGPSFSTAQEIISVGQEMQDCNVKD